MLAKALPHMDNFSIKYGELISIIEGYVVGSRSLGKQFENDSLFTVNSLTPHRDDSSEFRSLALHFLGTVNVTSFFFTHEYRSGNYLTQLLVKTASLFAVLLEWSYNIPADVSFYAIQS